MNIIVDGDPDLISPADGARNETLLSSIESALLSAGRSIDSYRWRGETISAEDLQDHFKNGDLGEEESLEITTISLQESLSRSIFDMSGGLEKSEEQLLQISETITQADPSAALKSLSTWMQDIHAAILNLEQLTHMFRVPQDACEVQGMSIQKRLLELKDCFADIQNLLKNDDRVSLADTLEHKVCPHLAPIREALPMVIEEIRKAIDPSN